MTYGCSAWSVAQERGEGYTKQTIDSLKSLQAKAARIIGGAHKATSGPALDTNSTCFVSGNRFGRQAPRQAPRQSAESSGYQDISDTDWRSGAYIVAKAISLIDKLQRNQGLKIKIR